jgi:membrane glycosyltransferase
MMLMQAVAVAEVLLGRDAGWTPQRREGVELRRRDAWRAHRGHVLLGVAGAAGALLVSKYFLMWASPVFLSLTLSALLSLHTSRPGTGRRRLFRIPEDADPPRVLARSLELRRAYAAEASARRQIEALLRADVPMYEFKAARRPALVSAWDVPAVASADQLAAPGLGQRVRAAAQVGAQVHDLAGGRGRVEHHPPAPGLALDGIGDDALDLAKA